jgi:hypothetical protein
MRDISPSSLVFLAILTAPACVPAVPRVETRAPPVAPADAPTAAPRDAGGDSGKNGSPDVVVDGRLEAQKESGLDAAREPVGSTGDATRHPPADAASDALADAASDALADAIQETMVTDAPRGRAPRAGELAIVELMVDPAGNDLGHEWIEVANLTEEALDLSTLHLSDGTTDVAVDAGVVAPRALLVLGQSIDRAHNGDAPVDRAYGTRLQLNNAGDRISICAGPCGSGAPLATFAWTSSFGAGAAGHAIAVGSGVTCLASEAYGAGGNFGTPGATNPACRPMDAGVLITPG